jgi:magnesium-transporting ATPase (P-type)
MNAHRLSVADALASVRSSQAGLSTAEASRRFAEYGRNRIEKIPRQPAVLRLVKEFAQFFSLILWVAAALAFLAEWLDPGQGIARIVRRSLTRRCGAAAPAAARFGQARPHRIADRQGARI